ncbi:hypothetical protein BV898_11379 [Hypsibius exemplaris]|uniref:Uncharacterized protein n=1 Tax=Hypsibius exemplaris TaxID=2072580 RepID=A0A1W0WGU5_HYPEX|nr:hypothetical protein BV898_11379 [Hypsibius exemplaris]
MLGLLQRPSSAVMGIFTLPGNRLAFTRGITGKIKLKKPPTRVPQQTARMEALRKAAAEKGIPGPQKLPEIRAKFGQLPFSMTSVNSPYYY